MSFELQIYPYMVPDSHPRLRDTAFNHRPRPRALRDGLPIATQPGSSTSATTQSWSSDRAHTSNGHIQAQRSTILGMASVVTAESVSAALVTIRQRVDDAGRDPDEVKVVAVTKRQPIQCAIAACDAGLDVAEDRVDELNAKAAAVPDARWH